MIYIGNKNNYLFTKILSLNYPPTHLTYQYFINLLIIPGINFILLFEIAQE